MLKRYLGLLLCVIVHGVQSGNNNELTFREKATRYMDLNKECNRIEAWEYDYSQFISVDKIRNSRPGGHIIRFTTYVFGARDVHILLSQTDTPDLINDDVYEFVIGAWDNSRTAIRKKTQNYPDLSNKETPGILIPEVPLKVVIDITDEGEITLLMEDPIKEVIVQAVDSSPTPIKFVSFATNDEALVEYFYNCPIEDKQLMSTKTTELTAKCKLVTLYEDTYNTFYPISDFNAVQFDGMLRFPLIIRGSSDAHILLSSKNYFDWPGSCEIVIGASENTRSYIRINDDEIKLGEILYKNILASEEPLILVFEINKASQIRVFAKENFDAKMKLLMVATLNISIPVNFISFHASQSSQVEFYFGCPYNLRRNDLLVAGEEIINEQSSFTKSQVFAECTKIGVIDGNQIQYHNVNDIRGAQPEGYLVRIPFFVMAGENVKVLLSSSRVRNFSTDKLYQIVIGAESNSRTTVRMINSEDEKDVIGSILESDILAPGRLVKVIVEVSTGGDIKVFIQNSGQKSRVLVAAYDPLPIPIRYIAFTTIGNSANEYYFKCNL